MGGTTTLLWALGYALALFGGAAWARRQRSRLERSSLRMPAYALALAVYCTSWTYFGAVGTAAASGWGYLPIYLGPIILFLFAPGFLRRLVRTVQDEGATSLSDFIGSRFGKNKTLAALVTVLALAGTIPYLALQLRSVGVSYTMLSGSSGGFAPICFAAVGLALFAILFGTRRYETDTRNEAVLFAVAAESVIKIVALCAIALFACLLILRAPADAVETGFDHLQANFSPSRLSLDFPVMTVLSLLAIVCLPRQFYIAVMEARQPEDIVRARYPFIAYLLVTVVAVIPVTLAGFALLPESAPPDFYVLGLPMATGHDALALMVFFGGLSAAAAMAVAECIALSTMVSNDLIAPLLLRNKAVEVADLGRLMLAVRRGAIILLMLAATIYALYIPQGSQLASLGLIAFAALAQAAPALIIAVNRSDGDPLAAKTGLMVGLVVWAYTLFLPGVGLRMADTAGGWLDPTALMGIGGMSAITHGTVWSLGGNMLSFLLVTLYRYGRPSIARRFVRQKSVGAISTMQDLGAMVERFVGPAATAQAFGSADPNAVIDGTSARKAERMIATVVGASSAHAIMASALSGASLSLHDIAQMLDASSQSVHFSRGLLAATLENIEPGVSVIDRDQRLIAWNSRYVELFGYPPGMVRIGTPVAELIRYNAMRGECGPGEVEGHVFRRLGHMRAGTPHSFERERPDGRVLKTVGGPMPDGGYVMCFTDITAEAQARASLEKARAELEQRVEERTAELSQANEKLAAAMADKTRFLAAASHDLLQPLHAARLFTASLKRDVPEKALTTLTRVDRSIEAANDLLRALLDISKLDAGGITPHPQRFSVRAMLAELVESFEPLAEERGLTLRLGPGDAELFTDRTLLRSIVQNFLSNAVRYSERGGILIGVRRRGDVARIEVYDRGLGIPKDKQDIIFREFERLGAGDAPGIGLGLAIVERTARLLDARIDLRSVPGQGSRFAVSLPLAQGEEAASVPAKASRQGEGKARHILVVDDDPAICDAMVMLLTSLGHAAAAAHNGEAALERVSSAATPYDAALIDYTLGRGMNGIELIDALHALSPDMPAALVTAERGADVLAQATARNVPLLPKPLDAAQLQAWLAGLDGN